ncbi:Ubiquitin carboxyl-terminal hydrolase [Chloropicon primus]|uniref:Ubiquitin carboxyl-terminal hydrolase n=1 Tax=Chloropicon primus TaxID=1764295 RepID=A0A5B8MHR1_9CHLO|nr:Ubiquitin carboxyl-terminal hydrolase [Chloropicon primus]UPQ99200.1 Ubiquitin carboxyl-terminal hydrolase [Chloropicon primus]|eukprot:QDZ19989.1 Ubiquitin carboxyl-terminal hydrolase [Chloropicon primus]
MVVGSKRGRLAVLAATRGGGVAGPTPKKKGPKVPSLFGATPPSNAKAADNGLLVEKNLSFSKLVTREESFAPKVEEVARVYTPSKAAPKSPLSHFKVAGKRRSAGATPVKQQQRLAQDDAFKRTPPPSFSPSKARRALPLPPSTPEPGRARSLGAALAARASEARRSSSAGGAGLQNFGQTCYMNAVLSVLIRTPSFARRVCRGSKGVAGALNVLIKGKDGGEAVRPPTELLMFRGGQQEDSHEFYLRLLEKLDDQSRLDEGGEVEGRGTLATTSCPSSPFTGSVEHSYTCSSCGHKSSSAESFKNISVTLPTSQEVPISVQGLVERYFAAEEIFKDCDSCKGRNIKHEKTQTLKRFPTVLCVHMKRLVSTDAGKLHKNTLDHPMDKTVSLPALDARTNANANTPEKEEEERELAPSSLAPQTPGISPSGAVFELYGAVFHRGGAESGHYVSFVRGDGDDWHLYNDSFVRASSWEEVRAQRDSFMLFFNKL